MPSYRIQYCLSEASEQLPLGVCLPSDGGSLHPKDTVLTEDLHGMFCLIDTLLNKGTVGEAH